MGPQRHRRVPKTLGICLFGLSLFAGAPRVSASPPSLIVLITSEQFRSDYLQLHEDHLSAGGFGRLLAEGAVYSTARYNHVATLSGPNAAVLATGTYPSNHGIIANRWYDRLLRRVVNAAESGPAREAPIASPLRLTGSTFADELRLATGGRSRVLTISGSEEAAVFLSGRRPTGCYWMQSDGTFHTSKYYRPNLPGWVEEFNALHGAVRAQGRTWIPVGQPEESAPLRVIDGATQGDLAALYRASPFAMRDTLALALRAAEAEGLGQGRQPDLLIVNVAAPARLAAETGAHSPLMRDMVLQLDRGLGAFFDGLDQMLGLENVGIVFTGLHGVAPLPEAVRAEGLSAGRVRGGDVVTTIDTALQESFGSQVYVEKFVYPHVYLSAAVKKAAPARRTLILRTAGQAAQSLAGVAGFFSPETGGHTVLDEDRVLRSRRADRAGDLVLIYEPFFAEDFGAGRGTTWGSYYRYDTDVPLIFHGDGFRAGRYHAVADAADVAPTLSAWLGIAQPSSTTGKVLAGALFPKATTGLVESGFVGPPPPPPTPSP